MLFSTKLHFVSTRKTGGPDDEFRNNNNTFVYILYTYTYVHVYIHILPVQIISDRQLYTMSLIPYSLYTYNTQE